MARLLRWIIFALAATGFAGTATGTTINTTPGGPYPNVTQSEPHIAAWGSVIVAAWNDAYNAPPLLLNGLELYLPIRLRTAYGYSLDGGQTWVDAGGLPTNPPTPGPPLCFPPFCELLAGKTDGDPVVAVDSAGNFYVATMASDPSLVRKYIGAAKATPSPQGVQFGTPVLVEGDDTTSLQDKPWLAVDTTSSPTSNPGRVYLCWKDYSAGTGTNGGIQGIRFVSSTSTTPSLQFGAAQRLSPTGTGCNIGIGPAGEVYLAWIVVSRTGSGRLPQDMRQEIHVRKSTDGGATWNPPETGVFVAKPARSGDREVNVNGPSVACGKPALNGHVRVPDWPLIAVDQSGGPYNGTVYIAYNAAGTTGADDADVFVVRSPRNPAAPRPGDPGVSWSDPVAINKAPAAVQGADPTTNDNWMPAIAVASNGTVAVSFYDRRADPFNMNINVYKAVSTNGGRTWKNEQVTPAAFGVPTLLPNFNPMTDDCYMGDYNGMAAAGTDFHLVWGDNSNLYQGNPDLPDPNIAYKSQSALCAFAVSVYACGEVPPGRLFPQGLTIRFPRRDWTLIDPMEKNCFYKWTCPPCSAGPGGLCPFTYTITFDFAGARLDPGVVAIRLLDFQGRDIATPRIAGGRTTFSFRPKGFRAGGRNEQLFFQFTLGPRGRDGTDYRVPVRLEVNP